jgi:hypothetical protein
MHNRTCLAGYPAMNSSCVRWLGYSTDSLDSIDIEGFTRNKDVLRAIMQSYTLAVPALVLRLALQQRGAA